MIIRQANVDLAASSTYKEEFASWERLQIQGSRGSSAPGADRLQIPIDLVSLSDEVQAKYQELKSAAATSSDNEETSALSAEDRVKVGIIEMMLQIISGRKVKLKLPKLSGSDKGGTEKTITAPSPALVNLNLGGRGISWQRETIYREQASMNFQAQGQVITQDGRAINFNLQLNLERSYWSRESIRVSAGQQAVDPLVINFAAASAMTGSTRFSFDLDSDGVNEDIAALQRGSGFLALDINGDGTINDGSELFGPQSGDGFTDLAAYDEDGNGWIDENDMIFNRLRIWTVEDDGQQLFTLQDKNIGAIYLGQTAANFALKNSQNQEQAHIRSNGIFLRENGSAGTVQDLDMIV